MVRADQFLDNNSMYFYLTMIRDFADTCAVAMDSDSLDGFVIGYRRPDGPQTIFVWQVCVAPASRCQGIATELVHFLTGERFDYVEATILESNTTSSRFFTQLATRWGGEPEVTPLYAASMFPDGHEGENLYRIKVKSGS
jgi:L-2,4-diaminobutyric acid acetyltransferase